MVLIITVFITLTDDNSKNLINKVNSVENHWVNYKGEDELDNKMIKTQFIPYEESINYFLNNDAYVSYYNSEKFIKTVLYEGDKSILESVDNANGVILSFNKENKDGIKLIKEE